VMVFRMLREDVKHFSVFAVVVLLGFTHAYALLTQSASLLEALPMFIRALAGDLDEKAARQAGDGGMVVQEPSVADHATSLLLLVYLLLVTVVLLNILVAMLNESYTSVRSQSELQWLLERARITTSIENEMSIEERRQLKYWVTNTPDDKEVCGRRLAFIRIEETRTDPNAREVSEITFESHSADIQRLLKDSAASSPPSTPVRDMTEVDEGEMQQPRRVTRASSTNRRRSTRRRQ
jgi:hypothetical protein